MVKLAIDLVESDLEISSYKSGRNVRPYKILIRYIYFYFLLIFQLFQTTLLTHRIKMINAIYLSLVPTVPKFCLSST